MTPEEWQRGDSLIVDYARNGQVVYGWTSRGNGGQKEGEQESITSYPLYANSSPPMNADSMLVSGYWILDPLYETRANQ